MITRNQAVQILNQNIKNKNLIKHALAVEAVMIVLARYFKLQNPNVKLNEQVWGIAGLLHDADWEVTQNDYTKHAKITVDWIKQATGKQDTDDQEIIDAILSHNYKHNGFREPKSPMEWSLYCCDELTGFIIAIALIKDKKLANVTVESVLKKFPQKAFAAGVSREQIALCQEKLGITIEEFIKIILSAMQNISEYLEL
jgi:uncharacterized protein